MFDIVVIGGGASGICAAIFAAKEYKNLKVAILEKNDRIGKKILVTGNGRCNISNLDLSINNFYTSKDKEFIKGIISQFDYNKTKDFFNSLGILFSAEDNKVFPNSFQASTVVDMLRFKIKELNVTEICKFNCIDILKDGESFTAISSDGDKIKAKAVIFSVGGMAYPQLGTDGSSYSILKKFGHKITPLFPSLVQLVCASKKCVPLKGVKFNGKISIYVDNEMLSEEIGEILFTDYGLSGPPVFLISRIASMGIYNKNNVFVSLDLMPEYSAEEIFEMLKQRNKQLTLDIFLNGMLNKIIGREIIKSVCNYKLNEFADKLTENELYLIAKTIKAWKFEISGTKGWKNAQVTAGGFELYKFNPLTLESYCCENLFVCGEALDVDGKCGGFNLQWAWSSGAVAGVNASKKVKEVL